MKENLVLRHEQGSELVIYGSSEGRLHGDHLCELKSNTERYLVSKIACGLGLLVCSWNLL